MFGDSITSGYQLQSDAAFPAMLERKLQSDGHYVDLVNMSAAANTIAKAPQRVNEVLQHAPDLVIVQLGSSDALRGVDVKEVIYPNLNKIAYELRAHEISVLICGLNVPEKMSKSYSQLLSTAYSRSAEWSRSGYYANILKGVIGRSDLTLADGLHPNEKGTLAMVHEIYPIVEEMVKRQQEYITQKESAF